MVKEALILKKNFPTQTNLEATGQVSTATAKNQ
jgi:hypothetical protein